MSSREVKKNRLKNKINYNYHVVVVNRSNKNVTAQILEPITKKTVATFDTYKEDGTKTEQSMKVGKNIAKYLTKNKIEKVVFDRNGYLFHGRIKAIADSIKENKINI